MNVTLNLICTRKYHVFVQPLIDSVCKYFLLRHDILVNIFTDNQSRHYLGNDRVKIKQYLIPSYGFPDATLLRYRIMSSIEYNCDYIVYFDVDYLIFDEVTEEILGPIVAVLHPGFAEMGGGSWCSDEKSLAYTKPENRKKYFAGGTQVFSRDHGVSIMKLLAERIDDDTRRGVKAEWNDESMWNWYLSENGGFKILDSRYCMVQNQEKRWAWKIAHLTPIILALDKDHAEFQQP